MAEKQHPRFGTPARRVLAAGLGLLAWGSTECNIYVIAESRIPVRDLVSDVEIRVVHLSDIHGKVFSGGNEGLIEDIGRFAPHMVAITGDLVNATSKDFNPALNLVERLSQLSVPVYYVPGNHEHGTGNIRALVRAVVGRGAVVLRNARAEFVMGSVTIDIVGLDDACSGHDSVAAATRGLVPERCSIMLTHAPEVVERLENAPIDLVLAGHTHGGQVRIPGLGALYAPGQGMMPRWSKGLYELGDGRFLYIDSGLGTSDVPLRFFTPAQFSVLTLFGKRAQRRCDGGGLKMGVRVWAHPATFLQGQKQCRTS